MVIMSDLGSLQMEAIYQYLYAITTISRMQVHLAFRLTAKDLIADRMPFEPTKQCIQLP